MAGGPSELCAENSLAGQGERDPGERGGEAGFDARGVQGGEGAGNVAGERAELIGVNSGRGEHGGVEDVVERLPGEPCMVPKAKTAPRYRFGAWITGSSRVG